MASANKIIERVDALRPNVFDDLDKGRWILEIEGRIYSEILKKDFSLRFPEDGDRELSLPEQYSNVYEYYLYAMMDWHNREFTEYNNDFLMFNSAWESMRRHFVKNNAKGTRFVNVVP